MIRLFMVGALWVFLGKALAENATSPYKTYWIQQHLYVDLQSWADRNEFRMQPLGPEEWSCTNRITQLHFKANTRKFELNGLGVWLGHPILPYPGTVLIAQQDLRTTLLPLMTPPKLKIAARLRTIVLDPGHGGKDPGFEHQGHQEKSLALMLAREVQRRLIKAGYRVYLTRTSDYLVDREERPALAKRKKADVFLSLHFNSASSDANGVEVYCLTPAGDKSTNEGTDGLSHGALPGNLNDPHNIVLAHQLQKALLHSMPVEDRGVRRARFAVLRLAAMPAVLVEAGFMSHPEEFRRLATASYRERLAQAIVDGLQAYRRLVEPSPPKVQAPAARTTAPGASSPAAPASKPSP